MNVVLCTVVARRQLCSQGQAGLTLSSLVGSRCWRQMYHDVSASNTSKVSLKPVGFTCSCTDQARVIRQRQHVHCLHAERLWWPMEPSALGVLLLLGCILPSHEPCTTALICSQRTTNYCLVNTNTRKLRPYRFVPPCAFEEPSEKGK